MNTLSELIVLGDLVNNTKLTIAQAFQTLLIMINGRLAKFDFSAIDRCYIYIIDTWKEPDYQLRELRWELTLGKKSYLTLCLARYNERDNYWSSARLENPTVERIHSATGNLPKAFEYFFDQLRGEKAVDESNYDNISKLITSLT